MYGMVVRSNVTAPPGSGSAPSPSSQPVEAKGLAGKYPVTSDEEKDWFESRLAEYEELFDNATAADHFDLDSLVLSELSVRRLQAVVTLEEENGRKLRPAELSARQTQLQRTSEFVNKRKDELGLSRKARQSQQGSLNEYVKNLMIRAKQFGVHRNEQAAAAITLLNELMGIVGAFDRSNAEEKQRLGYNNEADIVEYIRQKTAEYREIDEAFQQNQKMWVGTI